MSKDIINCKLCGNQPELKFVFGFGSYYQCKHCNFPPFQCPAPFYSTTYHQKKQWNDLNQTEEELIVSNDKDHTQDCKGSGNH